MEKDTRAIESMDKPTTSTLIKEEKKVVTEIPNNLAVEKEKVAGKFNTYWESLQYKRKDFKLSMKAAKRLSKEERKLAIQKITEKRKKAEFEEKRNQYQFKNYNEEEISELLKNSVIPLWKTSYTEQLKWKQTEAQNFVILLHKTVGYRWCASWPTKPSQLLQYLSECVFDIGEDHILGLPTIGLYVKCCQEGFEHVAPPDCLHIFPPSMFQVIKAFEKYIRCSREPVYSPRNHKGFWRQIFVRTSEGHTLIVIIVNPQKRPESALEQVKCRIRNFFTKGDGRNSGATSIYFWASNDRLLSESAFRNAELAHVHGNQCIEENMLDMKLNISPKSGFRANISAAAELYKSIAAMIDITEKTIVLDLDCGIGALGIHLAKKGAKVIGIDERIGAVTDAIINTYRNDVSTAGFLCGEKFATLTQTLDRLSNDVQITIITSPLNGQIGLEIIKLIRQTAKIEKLVFVSSCGKSALNDLLFLCKPSGLTGLSFELIEVGSFDTQPNTVNLELVFVLQRRLLRVWKMQ